MLRLLFRSMEARRARKVVLDVVVPLVDRSRLRFGLIPRSVWLDPYVMGFITSLATVLAISTAGSLGAEALGAIQVAAWQAVADDPTIPVGDQVAMLSATADPQFTEGARNGAELARLIASHQRWSPADAAAPRQQAILAAWSAMFDDRLPYRAQADAVL